MACHIINISPKAALDENVAEEVWSGKDVDYSLMKIFGCATYIYVFSDERSKLDPKSKRYIFLGYKKGVKGYKFWDSESKKVVINIDVVFDKLAMLKTLRDDQKSVIESTKNDEQVI